MGSLSLYLSKPQIAWRLGEASFVTPGWTLSWSVHFDRFYNHVEVSKGGDLSEMPGRLLLRAGTVDASRHEGADDQDEPSILQAGPPIGTLRLVPACGGSRDGVDRPRPDSYSVELFVSAEELHRMIEGTLAARGPKSVYISVPNIDFGSLPGGEIQRWNVDETRWTSIDGATFQFGEDATDSLQDEEDEKFAAGAPPPPPPSEEARALNQLNAQFRGATVWVVMLLVAIFAAVMIRQ